jgi:FMN-dependent NADH-azoreductase
MLRNLIIYGKHLVVKQANTIDTNVSRRSSSMPKLLYIKVHPRPVEQSYTLKVAETFMDEYRKANPTDEIVTLDLYKEGIRFLDASMVDAIFSGSQSEMSRHANLFASADRYVIAAPMWNLGSPAILKAYFDYVSIAGITFKYTDQGPVGLLSDQDRKVVHIVARGGGYGQDPMKQVEMGDRYLRTILGFFGINNITTIPVEMTNILKGNELEKVVDTAMTKAREVARNFSRSIVPA